MKTLDGRQRRVLLAFASVLLGGPAPPRVAEQAEHTLSRVTRGMRIAFRLALVILEWGTFLVVSTDGRFERFSRLAWPAKCRYVHDLVTHPNALVRQLFTFVRVIVLMAHYDARPEAARAGDAREWLC